jgi:hypothetical protein
MTQGGNANKTGALHEAQVKAVFDAWGFKSLDNRVVLNAITIGDPLSSLGERWYTTQLAHFRNLYSAKFKSDLFVYDTQHWPNGLLIECKYQALGGSVDEKYVFTVLSLKNLPPPSAMVLTGGGARNCAISWIRGQETPKFKFFGSSEQFSNWIHKKLR